MANDQTRYRQLLKLWSLSSSLFLSSRFEEEKKILFLEKREEKPIFRSLSSRRFLSRQFASSKTARRDKKEWVWKRGEWLVESFLPAMRCVTEGIGRRRKRLAEGCFERITTNSLAPEKWPTFDRRRNPRLLLFPRVELFLKFRNYDDRAINFFFIFFVVENRVEKFGNEFRSRNRNGGKRVEFFFLRAKAVYYPRNCAAASKLLAFESRPTSLPG